MVHPLWVVVEAVPSSRHVEAFFDSSAMKEVRRYVSDWRIGSGWGIERKVESGYDGESRMNQG